MSRNVFFDPLICARCGDRLGWIDNDTGKVTALIYCEKCSVGEAKQVPSFREKVMKGDK